jgi:MinD-like ATPase involved in chromosome partitioning or flagellar assembly
MNRKPGEVITFYSYKGGVGRSMALANMAWMLAARGNKVLVIDWDLEAPGLHRYFAPFVSDPQLTQTDGLIDFLLNYCDAVSTPMDGTAADSEGDWIQPFSEIHRYAQSLAIPGLETNGSVDFVGAGRQDAQYGQRVGLFDWSRFYEKLGGGALLNRMRRSCLADYDYTLIDSRTGLSDTAGICTAQLPDKVVCLYTYNVQSVEGASGVAASAFNTREALRQHTPGDGLGRLNVFPVGSRMEVKDPERLTKMRQMSAARFERMLWHLPSSERDQYFRDVELPYAPDLAYNEVLAVLDDAEDVKTYLAACYRTLERVLGLGPMPRLSFPRSTASEIWQQFYESAVNVSATLPPVPKKPTVEADVLASITASHADAMQVLIRRVVLRSVSTADDAALRFVPVRMWDLRPPEREAAQALVREGVMTLQYDVVSEGRVLTPANEDELRKSAIFQQWTSETATFRSLRDKLQAAYLEWQQAGVPISAVLSKEFVDENAELVDRHIGDMSPAELRVWRLFRELDGVRGGEALAKSLNRRLTWTAALSVVLIAVLSTAAFALSRERNRVDKELRDARKSFAELVEKSDLLRRRVRVSDAWQAYNRKDYEGAEKSFTEAIEQDVKDVSPVLGRSYVRGATGRFSDAASDLENALALANEQGYRLDPSMYYVLGTYHKEARNDTAALLALREYVSQATASKRPVDQATLGQAKKLIEEFSSKPQSQERARVVLNFPDSANQQVFAGVVKSLRSRGFSVKEEIQSEIARAEVIYFKKEDEKWAREVLAVMYSDAWPLGDRPSFSLTTPGAVSASAAARGVIEVNLPPIRVQERPKPMRSETQSTPNDAANTDAAARAERARRETSPADELKALRDQRINQAPASSSSRR